MAWNQIYHLFEDIREIAEQQLLLAHRIEDPEAGKAMLKLMKRRQAITDRIDRLSKKIPDYNEIGNSNERIEVLAIINDIQKFDRQSQELIEAGRERTGKKLGNVRNNQKAYNAYMPNIVSTEGWFFDRKK